MVEFDFWEILDKQAFMEPGKVRIFLVLLVVCSHY